MLHFCSLDIPERYGSGGGCKRQNQGTRVHRGSLGVVRTEEPKKERRQPVSPYIESRPWSVLIVGSDRTRLPLNTEWLAGGKLARAIGKSQDHDAASADMTPASARFIFLGRSHCLRDRASRTATSCIRSCAGNCRSHSLRNRLSSRRHSRLGRNTALLPSRHRSSHWRNPPRRLLGRSHWASTRTAWTTPGTILQFRRGSQRVRP